MRASPSMWAVKASVAEDVGKRPIAHIEPARIGSKGRQDHAPAVACEATPPHGFAASAHPRHRMQMTRHFAGHRAALRHVAEHQRANRQGRGEASAHLVRRVGIVVAGDPEPVAPALQGGERGAVLVGEPCGSFAIVEAVAQRDNRPRRVSLNDGRQSLKCLGGIIGRQQHAAGGVT